MAVPRILSLLLFIPNIWAATDGMVFGLHWVVECTAPGASYPLPVPGGPNLCLERMPVVNQSDVASAWLDEATGIVRLNLRTSATEHLRERTTQRIGSRLAVVLDGKIVAAPVVMAPVDQAMVPGLSAEDARSVISVFTRGTQAKAASVLRAGSQGSGRTFRLGGINSPPVPIHKPDPEYTAEARAARIQGSVILKVIIGEDGTTSDIQVVRGLDPGLDAKAVECVRTWRFRPAMKQGRPVAFPANIEMNFRL